MATDAASILSIALQVVSTKIVFIIALAMSFGLWSWAMWAHEWIAVATAAGFTLLVFLPVLMRGDGNAKNRSPTE
jgi:hypothetical protein